MTKLTLIGAGGHGKVAAEAASAAGYEPITFLDNAWPERDHHSIWPILGPPEQADSAAFCAVGDNVTRARLTRELKLTDAPLICHPQAILSSSCTLGSGTLAAAGVIVNADAHIGRGVILNTACSVDHDCQIGDFVHISPGAHLAGGVSVGERSWIGIGAVVKEGVTIGKDVMVGAGAAVIEDIADGARVGGVPARKL